MGAGRRRVGRGSSRLEDPVIVRAGIACPLVLRLPVRAVRTCRPVTNTHVSRLSATVTGKEPVTQTNLLCRPVVRVVTGSFRLLLGPSGRPAKRLSGTHGFFHRNDGSVWNCRRKGDSGRSQDRREQDSAAVHPDQHRPDRNPGQGSEDRVRRHKVPSGFRPDVGRSPGNGVRKTGGNDHARRQGQGSGRNGSRESRIVRRIRVHRFPVDFKKRGLIPGLERKTVRSGKSRDGPMRGIKRDVSDEQGEQR